MFFPNALLIIDRLHIVKHLNQAFQEFRVREIKNLKQQNKTEAYKKIKSQLALLYQKQTEH